MNNNVNSNAKIIQTTNTQDYEFGKFIQNETVNPTLNEKAKLDDSSINGNVDPILNAILELKNNLKNIENKVSLIENDGIKGRDLDSQVIKALKDLKNYASFFEKATFELESKILKTSMNIAKKIISVEIGEQSTNIAKMTIDNILNKIKTASKVTIHLNPKDFIILKDELNLEDFIILQEDENVNAGGVVIASDLGNFDGNVEAKVQTIIESIENII